MKYYDRNIADYQSKTVHLSLAEHGAYALMLDTFYFSEKPLPTGKALYRLLRADSPAERKAIDAVVAEFWILKDGALVQKRAQETLDEYRAWVEKQRANAKRSHSHGSANGKPSQSQATSDGSANGGDMILDLDLRPHNMTSHTNGGSSHGSATATPNRPGSGGGKKRIRTAEEIEAEERAHAEH